MKLLRDDEMPAPPAVESYQETAWTALAVGLVLLASAAALIIWPLAESGWRLSWPVALLGLPALIVLLIGGPRAGACAGTRRGSICATAPI